MNQQKIGAFFAGLLSLTLAPTAEAVLMDRGGGLIYDSTQDITWLQDANLGAGTIFDNGSSSTDGQMTWASAVDWADNLVFGGFDDWRLPTTGQPDSTCSSQLSNGDGARFNCTGSEMGHLYNVENISIASQGLFKNVQSRGYWSGTEFAPNPDVAWYFAFSGGFQGTPHKATNLFAWAVRTGDVSAAAVPEPSTISLLGLGLVGMLGAARRKR